MRLVPLALVLAALAAPAASGQDRATGRLCATPEPTVLEVLQTQQAVRAFESRTAALRAAGPVTVPVAVHVISAGPGMDRGEVPQARIEAQIDTLNQAFAAFGVRFALALVQRVENPSWYLGLRVGSARERAMKEALALDPARVLNLYTVRPASDFLGWATTPDAGAERDVDQGVVVLDQSLPGGSATPFDLGHTGTHEVGHWLGLLHPFSGGCSQPNDGVDDTPQQASGTIGCPARRDSCPLDPGDDRVHNYMDYSNDACMTGFTAGQRARSAALVAQFRPTIAAGGFALATVPATEVDTAFVGVSVGATLRVTNATDAPFTVTGVTSEGVVATATGLPAVVAPGAAVALPLAVRPAAAGPFSGTVRVATTGPGPLAAPVAGVAVLPPTARLAAASVRATVIEGADAERTVTLANDGDGPLTFAVDPGALPEWVASVTPASGVVPPRGEVALAVSLASGTLAPRVYAQPLPIRTNDPVRGTVAVAATLEVLVRPTALAVRPAFPNPTRGRVTIPLALPDAAPVRAVVYDARGRRLAEVADGAELAAGYPELTWDATGLPAGVYFVRVATPAEAAVARVVVTR